MCANFIMCRNYSVTLPLTSRASSTWIRRSKPDGITVAVVTAPGGRTGGSRAPMILRVPYLSRTALIQVQ
jgi:hypothetical protein